MALALRCIYLSIMEAHGGKIWAKNNSEFVHYDATVYFSLPMVEVSRVMKLFA